MRIEIYQPHPDYPFAWVTTDIVYKSIDPEKFGFDSSMALTKRNITILGPWERVSTKGDVITLKVPVLLEDQHVKPKTQRKTQSKRK